MTSTSTIIEHHIAPILERRDSPTTTRQNRLDWAVEVAEWGLLTASEIAALTGLEAAIVDELHLEAPDGRKRRHGALVAFLTALGESGESR